MLVVGVDPGKTVGVAYQQVAGYVLAGEVPFDEFGDWIESVLRSRTESIVVCERFVISSQTVRKSSDAHWAIEATGVARHYARRYGATFVQYTSGESKGFVKDVNIKEAGWWMPGKGHAMDAVRQVVLAGVNDVTPRRLPPWLDPTTMSGRST